MTIQLPPVDPALVDAASRLDIAAATARHADLAAQVERANELYYAKDAPELSDADYDALFRELVALETAYPELTTAEIADPARGRDAGRHVRRGPPQSPDAVAVERVQP